MLLHTNANAQFKKISTQDITNCIDQYGLDSAMNIVINWNDNQIFSVDTILYKKILSNITSENSKYLWLLLDADKYIKDSVIGRSLYSVLNDHYSNIRNLAIENNFEYIKQYNYYSFGYDYCLYKLTLQNYKPTETLLLREYLFWSSAIQKLKNHNGFHRFFDILRNKDILGYCHFKCRTLQLGLQAIKSKNFSKEKLDFHLDNVENGKRSAELCSYLRGGRGFSDRVNTIITLRNEYNSIQEIDFNKEPELKVTIEDYMRINHLGDILLFYQKIGFFYYQTDGWPEGPQIKLILLDNKRIKVIRLHTLMS